jgi:cell division protein FtsL
VNIYPDFDRAKNGWSLRSSFGDREQWKLLEEKMNKVMEHSQKDPEFENLIMDVSSSIQKLLIDPAFMESLDKKIQELREKVEEVDIDSFLF